MKYRSLFLAVSSCAVAITLGTATGSTVLGTGTAALLGGDLTDPENDGTPDGLNYNATFFSSDEPGFGGGEFAFNVFNNVVGGGNAKWCCGTTFPQIVGATFASPVQLTHFTLASANDTPGRDPVDWSIQGSNDGSNWSTIFSHSGSNVWTLRNQVIRWDEGADFATPNPYTRLRLVVTRTGLTGGAFFQLAEVEFFGHVIEGITVIDDDSDTLLTDGQTDVLDFGCTKPEVPVTKTFTIRNDSPTDELVLRSNGLTLPDGYSLIPGWPTAFVEPEFRVVVDKQDSGAAIVDSLRFELVTMPEIISIDSISIRVPDRWIDARNGPNSQSPYVDESSGIELQSSSATSDLDISEVNGVGSGWFCPVPGAFDVTVDGDVCVDFSGRNWQVGNGPNQETRWQEATLRFRRFALTGSLDDPTKNGDFTFGFGLTGLNPPTLPNGTQNDGDGFAQAGIEVKVVLFNRDTGLPFEATGVFQSDNDDNGISVVTFTAPAVETVVPVVIPPGSTWEQEIGTPLTVQLDAIEEGTFSGDWSLENSDPDENPFNFPITGIVDGTPPTIDNLPEDIVAPAEGTSCEAIVTWTPPTVSDNIPIPPPTLEQTKGLAPGSTFEVGVHEIEYTATDCAGNVTVESFFVSVRDLEPPTLIGTLPKRIIRSIAPGATTVIVDYGELRAEDNCDPDPEVICTPPNLSEFELGLTEVCCFARDSSGNTSPEVCFDVVVIQAQPSPLPRDVKVVTERNSPAPGVPDATIQVINHAFLNEAGAVAIEATMLGAGTGNLALWKDIGSGLELVSRKGDIAPDTALPIKRFDDVILNDSNELGFELFVSDATPQTDTAHVSDVSGSVGMSLIEGGTPPGSPELFVIVHEPAFDGLGATVTPANLKLDTAGVTVDNDTGIWRKPAGAPLAELARENSLVGLAIPDAVFGQIAPRVVANGIGHVAFYAFLKFGLGGVTAANNAAIFSGPLGDLGVVAREGQLAPGPDAALFLTFSSESINNAGKVAFEAGLKSAVGGPVVNSANNTGIYTNSNDIIELVAREGDVAPCLPGAAGVFSSFRDIFIVENGDVYFHAFLTGDAVGSNNDGTFWRWQASDSTLHPVLREGNQAPSTEGAVLSSLLDFAVSDDGLHAVTAKLVPGVGDCQLSNNYGLWMDDGTDGIPILKIREGDFVDLGLIEETFVTVLSIEKTTNWAGGSGGHGKVLNDAGEIILKAGYNLNTSGAIVLPGTVAPPVD